MGEKLRVTLGTLWGIGAAEFQASESLWAHCRTLVRAQRSAPHGDCVMSAASRKGALVSTVPLSSSSGLSMIQKSSDS